jgi:hypothetical protein
MGHSVKFQTVETVEMDYRAEEQDSTQYGTGPNWLFRHYLKKYNRGTNIPPTHADLQAGSGIDYFMDSSLILGLSTEGKKKRS